MSDRLEWAHVNTGAELLYPGSEVDDAVVEPGEIAVALWTGSNGIALHGPRERVRERLLQLAAAVDAAPPVPAESACIPQTLDPSTWRAEQPVSDSVKPTSRQPARCGKSGPVVTDPRLSTCPGCVEDWNDEAPATVLRLEHRVPALP